MKRSMAVNIYLKQFRSTLQDVIDRIKSGDAEKVGTERVKGLSKILPEKDEVRHHTFNF